MSRSTQSTTKAKTLTKDPHMAAPASSLAPRIVSFETAETQIFLGYPTIFSWEVEGADQLEISGGVGEVSGRTFVEAYLTQPGVYRLTATNEHAQTTAVVELTLPQPEIQSFFPSGYQIIPGVSNSLFWEVSYAEEVILLPHDEPVTDLRRIDVMPDRTTTYELIAKNASGEVRRELTLTLPPPDIQVFEGDHISTEGEPITLRWSVANAHRVTIEPGIGEVKAEGTLRVRPHAPFVNYLLRAEGHSGTASASFDVVRFPIPIALDDLDDELTKLLNMSQPPSQLPPMGQPESDLLSSTPEPIPSPEDLTAEISDDVLAADPLIRRVQEMELNNQLLQMEKAHVRTEVKNALRKIKRILKRKLQRQ